MAVLVLVAETGIAASRFDQLDFYPNVEIFRPTAGEAIEIVLHKTHYQATYNDVEQKFDPIEMKFDVVSKLGGAINYGLKLTISSHHCQHLGDPSSESELRGVELSLDGSDFIVDEDNPGLPFDTTDSRTHHMTLQSPIVEMTNHEQVCYGLLGISAALSEGSI